MNSRHRLAVFALALLVSVGATQEDQRLTAAGRASQTAAQPNALADEFLREFVLANPLAALFLGIPNAPNDTLGDNSIDGTKRWQTKEDEWLKRLKQISVSDLSVSDQVTYGTLLELVEGSVETRICREELWPLNQQGGLQVTLASDLSQLQPVGTNQLRSDALKRWHDMPRFIDTEIQTLQEGLRKGYTLPRENVKAIIDQLDDLLKMLASSSPFSTLGNRDSAPGLADAVREIVDREIMPALNRYRDFLRDEYSPQARIETAIAALPHGTDCYRARVRRYATIDMAPDAIHQLGLDQMHLIGQQMSVIGSRVVNAEDVPTIVQRLRSDPKYKFETRKQIVQVTERAVQRAREAMPRILSRMPKAAFIVEPCEPFEEKSGCPGSYVSPPRSLRMENTALWCACRCVPEQAKSGDGVLGYPRETPSSRPLFVVETSALLR